MSLLISVQKVEKSMGDRVLFEGLSFGIHEKEKIALLGPNGAGKSTLLKILAGLEPSDQGEVSPKKNLLMAYVPQEDRFQEEVTALQASVDHLREFGLDESTAQIQSAIHLSMAGFDDHQVPVKKLSGGWKKRLALAIAFAKEAELLLLDEPTNHLDWEGIEWLEGQLKTFKNSALIISHDREFLNNQCQEFMEVSRLYENGFFQQQGSYENFIEKRQQYQEQQLKKQESLSNKAKREVEWLRAGVKARTTKSQSRIKEAHQLLDDLGEVKQRNLTGTRKTQIQIEKGGKKSKKLIETKNLSIHYGSKTILKDLNMTLGPNQCLGVLGDNASGKTSLLKVLAQSADNFQGELFHAEGLKIVYFDQKRASLQQDSNLMEYLGDGSDHVTFNDKSVHVASYASRFLFDSQKMNLPIRKLSGGEQARLLIAKILLQPADALILDEPTNDLDIATIEILEESIKQFPGLCLLVSHDRYFLKNCCSKYIALDGEGGWEIYPELNQWLRERTSAEEATTPTSKTTPPPSFQKKEKIKLSYKEKRFLETVEDDILTAEENLEVAKKAMTEQEDFSDHEKTQALVAELNKKQQVVDDLYKTWDEIEEKQNQIKEQKNNS